MAQTVFKRTEKKYLISETQYLKVMEALQDHLEPDQYKASTIFSLYFDTPDCLLMRRSIQKPVYKEKLRLRTYGIPEDDTKVFLEIKKKFKKIVYKRRVKIRYRDVWALLSSEPMSKKYKKQRQILDEIKWFLQFYHKLEPFILITYDRLAYYGKEENKLRVTFDSNLLWRDKDLMPTEGAWGEALLPEGCRIMEIKIPGAMPLWLAEILSELEIFPNSFSKVGTAYRKKLSRGEINYG